MTEVLVGSQSSLISQAEKSSELKETNEEESKLNPTNLYNEYKIDQRSRKIIECLDLKPFILEDEDEDEQRIICFIPDSKNVQKFKNNNKRLKLTEPSSSVSLANDCIHTPKKYLPTDKILKTSPYSELLSFKKYVEINEGQLILFNTSWR